MRVYSEKDSYYIIIKSNTADMYCILRKTAKGLYKRVKIDSFYTNAYSYNIEGLFKNFLKHYKIAIRDEIDYELPDIILKFKTKEDIRRNYPEYLI